MSNRQPFKFPNNKQLKNTTSNPLGNLHYQVPKSLSPDMASLTGAAGMDKLAKAKNIGKGPVKKTGK